MDRIVVTGGLGFVGSHIVSNLCDTFPRAQIVIIDKFCYPARLDYVQDRWHGGRLELLTGDICDVSLCREGFAGAHLLIHAAAESHVCNSFLNSTKFIETNVTGTHTVMGAALSVGVPKIIHVSTDEVYGERPHEDVDEDGSLCPTNPYSASKAAADLLVLARYKADRLPVMIVRANNMYGRNQFPEKVIPRFICNALLGQKLPVQGDGRTLRSFLSADDFAKALIMLAERGTIGDVYNIGSADEYSVLDIAGMVARAFGRDVAEMVDYVPDRPFNDSRYGISDARIRALGWRQRRHLADDFDDLIGWYRSNLRLYDGFLATGERIGQRAISALQLALVPQAPRRAGRLRNRAAAPALAPALSGA